MRTCNRCKQRMEVSAFTYSSKPNICKYCMAVRKRDNRLRKQWRDKNA